MSRNPSSLPLLAACAVALLALPANANDGLLSIQTVSTALVGDGHPKVIVELRASVAELRVELSATDGTVASLKRSRVRPGRYELVLKHRPGTVEWTGFLEVREKEETQSLPLSFETTLLAAPSIRVADDAVDLPNRRLAVSVDRDGGTLEVRVLSDEGEALAHFTQAFDALKAGELRHVTWSQPDAARVLRIDVRATDAHGLYADVELYPWRIDVPHEDVLFETGRALIREAETPKLAHSHTALAQALSRYGRFAKVQLFVLGHSDTVGDAGSNQALSEARALAIARWFRQRGVRVPIHYAGAGESRLLIPTADEVDEPENRRVEYIVAVEPPSGIVWQKLK